MGFGEAGAGTKKSQGQLLQKQALERVLHGLRRKHAQEECVSDGELSCAWWAEQRLREATARGEFCDGRDKAQTVLAFCICFVPLGSCPASALTRAGDESLLGHWFGSLLLGRALGHLRLQNGSEPLGYKREGKTPGNSSWPAPPLTFLKG